MSHEATSPADLRLPEWFDRMLGALERRLELFGADRWWKLKLAMLCSLCAVVYATPNFRSLSSKEPPRLWSVIRDQSTHPLRPVSGLDPASHEAKRVFRLTMPLLAKLCPVDDPRAKMLFLFGVQYAAGALFFVLCATLFHRLLGSVTAATLLTLSTAFIYPGQACFYDLFGFFDGIALVSLLLTLTCRSLLVVFVALTAAFWVDERAIVASSFTYLWLKMDEGATGWREMLLPGRRSFVMLLAILMTLILRWWLARQHGFALPTAPEGGIGFMRISDDAALFRLPIGLLSPFKLHWLLLGLAAVWLWTRQAYAFLALGLAAVGASVAAAVAVVDITRSLAFAFPALLVATRCLAGAAGARFYVGLGLVLLLLAIALPSYNVMTGAAWMYPLPVKVLLSPMFR